ncbi:unnamed protein product, partial [Mesorhabditis spiculigera]
MRSLVMVLLCSLLAFALAVPFRGEEGLNKRDVQPEWEDLGWAWGKRSDPNMRVRMLRSLQPMKKNPEWHDLGWTWGRK